MRRFLIVVVVLALLLGGAYLFAGGRRPPNADVETAAVTRGPLESTIELAGTVAARETRTVAFATAGTIADVLVEEGAEVATDAVLARLDATTQAAQVRAAAAAVAAAAASLTSAESRLDADRDAGAPKAVRDADRAQIAAARAQLESARSQLAAAEGALALTEIRAPIAGTVVALGLAVGDRVAGSAALGDAGGAAGGSNVAGTVTIADLAALRVETTASEIDIVALSLDQPVALAFDALPDLGLDGTICEIATAGRDTGGVVEFDVVVCLDGDDDRLRVGMSSNVSIVLASVDDALIVPSQAIRLVDGAASVRVLDADGTIRVVPVEVGISSGTRTQVLSGLVEGERVVVGDAGEDT